jgi:hypothetical protein
MFQELNENSLHSINKKIENNEIQTKQKKKEGEINVFSSLRIRRKRSAI